MRKHLDDCLRQLVADFSPDAILSSLEARYCTAAENADNTTRSDMLQWLADQLGRLKSARWHEASDVDTLKCGTNLDVTTPEELPAALRLTAEHFRESETELQSAWQDENAGRVWREFAKILERAAVSCDKAIAKYV